MNGRQIALLLEGAVPPGEHSALWDVRKYGELSGGVYFYRLDAQSLMSSRSFSETRKMTFIK